MGALFFDKPVVIIFMVDTNVFSYADFGSYLVDVTEVLRHLQQNWLQSAVTYLGFLITREGINPQPEKIQGTLNMQRPGTQKDVRCFVGMVNFYRDLFPKRAETLATLMDLCRQKKKFIVRESFPENKNNLSSRDNAHLP